MFLFLIDEIPGKHTDLQALDSFLTYQPLRCSLNKLQAVLNKPNKTLRSNKIFISDFYTPGF